MERKRKMPRSSPRESAQPDALELLPEYAFVFHLDARAQPPGRVVGRIEHITSGRVARVRSLQELLDFIAQALGGEDAESG